MHFFIATSVVFFRLSAASVFVDRSREPRDGDRDLAARIFPDSGFADGNCLDLLTEVQPVGVLDPLSQLLQDADLVKDLEDAFRDDPYVVFSEAALDLEARVFSSLTNAKSASRDFGTLFRLVPLFRLWLKARWDISSTLGATLEKDIRLSACAQVVVDALQWDAQPCGIQLAEATKVILSKCPQERSFDLVFQTLAIRLFSG